MATKLQLLKSHYTPRYFTHWHSSYWSVEIRVKQAMYSCLLSSLFPRIICLFYVWALLNLLASGLRTRMLRGIDRQTEPGLGETMLLWERNFDPENRNVKLSLIKGDCLTWKWWWNKRNESSWISVLFSSYHFVSIVFLWIFRIMYTPLTYRKESGQMSVLV